MATETPKRQRLTIRTGHGALSFSVIDKQVPEQVRYEAYAMKKGMSVAANLREAFSAVRLLQEGYDRARVLLDTPVLHIPIEQFNEAEMTELYRYTFHGRDNDDVYHTVLPSLNDVAVFSINKDLKGVLADHFSDIRLEPLMLSVWRHMLWRSSIGKGSKEYGYFHNGWLDIFSFERSRFRFCNTFEVKHVKDAMYFLLYVFRQLNMQVMKDELAVFGDIGGLDGLVTELRKFVQRSYAILPAAEFNRAPFTQIKDFPFDLMTTYLNNEKLTLP